MLWAALGLAAAYAVLRWLLPWALPFLIAWGLAALLEPLVTRLHRRGVPRGLAAGFCLIGLLGTAGALLWLLLSRLAGEASALLKRLPEMFTALSAMLAHWETRLSTWLDRAPQGVGLWLEQAVAGAEETLTKLPGQVSARALRLVPTLAATAPSALLFVITAVIGAYFISAAYPDLTHLAARQLPDRFLCRARLLRRDLRRTLGRWVKAQCIMLCITFVSLAAAFLLLHVNYALLLALGTALIDALPVLGTGTVLLPWALYEGVTGNVPLSVGLVITYAAVTVLHQSIQAKLLGDQLGLHPLATLASIYVGWKVWGVAGMVVFPILAVCVKQTLAGGVLRTPGGRVEYQ